MQKSITLVGNMSQNGDDLPQYVEVTDTGFTFDIEQEMDTQEPPQPIPANFFLVKRGFFGKGKCALIFNQSENNQSKPSNIIVDHNYGDPDKIKFTTLDDQGIARNGILNNTPFQITVRVIF